MQRVGITKRPTRSPAGEMDLLHARDRQAIDATPRSSTILSPHDQTARAVHPGNVVTSCCPAMTGVHKVNRFESDSNVLTTGVGHHIAVTQPSSWPLLHAAEFFAQGQLA